MLAGLGPGWGCGGAARLNGTVVAAMNFRGRAWRAAHQQHAGVDAAGGQDGAGHIFTIVQDVIGRGACTRVASARARQRASAQRVRFAAPVQRAQLFQHDLELYDLQLRA